MFLSMSVEFMMTQSVISANEGLYSYSVCVALCTCCCGTICCMSVVVVLFAYQAVSCRGLEQNPVRDMMHQQLAALQHSIIDQHISNKHLLNELLKYRNYLNHKSKLEHAPLSSLSCLLVPFPCMARNVCHSQDCL